MSAVISPRGFTRSRIATYLIFALALFGLNSIEAFSATPAQASNPSPMLLLDPGNAASYPGSGTTWNDISGSGYSLGASPSSNFPTYSASNGGVFNFSAGSLQAAATTSNFAGVSTFTAEAYFNLSDWPTADRTSIITTQYGGSGIVGPTLYISSTGKLDGGYFDGNYWRTAYDDYNASPFPGFQLSKNTWYSAVVTFDGANVRLYVNNSLVSTSTENLAGTSSNRSVQLRVGTRWDGDGSSSVYTSGSIGVVKVYNSALTAAQITTDYATYSGRYFPQTSVSATGSNASLCNQTGTNLGNGSTDVTAVGTTGGYCVVTFSNPSIAYSWTVPTGVSAAQLLIVGGGGAGGGGIGGGGGAGEFVPIASQALTSGSSISIKVGAGGVSSNWASGKAGSSSIFGSITAYGGGGGGTNSSNPAIASGGPGFGSQGGNGFDTSPTNSVATRSDGVTGYRNNGGGGSGGGSDSATGGGGGGAGGAGGAGTTSSGSPADTGGAGGAGKSSSITGTATYYAAGGGGGINGAALTATGSVGASTGNPGAGGSGIGGTGGAKANAASGSNYGNRGDGTNGTVNSNGTAGAANTGSGGGGASNWVSGGAGGSGVVIISYPMPPSFSSATITGTAQIGTALTATASTITGAATTTTYQWQNSATANGTYAAISGTTGATYTPTSTDLGKYLEVVITVSNTSGTASQTSVATSAVIAQSVAATGTNASLCTQTGSNLGNGTSSDITAVGTASGYCIVSFLNPNISYSWTVPTGVTAASVLVVGGGGGGGGNYSGAYAGSAGGGGGGGVYPASTVPLTPNASISISVGAGGAGGSSSATSSSTYGYPGGTSAFSTISAGGGGGGGCSSATSNCPTTNQAGINGTAGGSGGGATNFWNAYNSGAGASGSSAIFGGTTFPAIAGFAGGYYNEGGTSASNTSGPGGGAGGAASRNTIGPGLTSSITGSAVVYGAGGGAYGVSGWSFGATTGYGTGGSGAYSASAQNGASGANGVVIVSYPMPPSFSTATIAGTAQVGSTLTASASTITGGGTTTTYQWQSSSTSNGTYSAISGATNSTYTLATSDYGMFIRVVVTVTNTSGSATQTSSATSVVTAGTPTVTGLTVSVGSPSGGTSITITGTNFQGVTGVKFGSSSATGVVTNSATSITAISPAGSGTVDVTVINGTGTSATSSADQYTYALTSVSATGVNASACTQTGNNLGNTSSDISVSGLSSGYCVVQFLNPAITYSWTVPTGATSAEILMVGGGGAGGMRAGGGGGAGGYLDQTGTALTPGATVSINVGAGGIGSATTDTRGGNGGNSQVVISGTTTKVYGGGGGATASATTDTARTGSNGGSGGGSVGEQNNTGALSGGSPTVAGQGNAGGSGPANTNVLTNWPGGGGGGAGGAGWLGTTDNTSSASNSQGGTGGAGKANSITGSSVCYATGGGGGINTGLTGGPAGTCPSFAASINGGSGKSGATTPATPTANTGAGGGASGYGGGSDVAGGNGASGIVVISYGMVVSYTYDANNGTGTAPTGGSARGGTSFTTAANTFSRSGYTFSGWNTAANGTGTALTANASNTMPASATALVFYAQWTANVNTVAFNTQGGSAVSSLSWSTGTSLTLPAAPTRSGYTFNGWYDASTGGNRVIKNALSFDGVNDRITIPHSSAFNFTNAMTIEAWVNTTSSSAQYITTKGDDSFYFEIAAGGTVGVYLNGSPSTGWIYSSTTVNDGNWHHIAATYNGSLVKIIIDGVERASVAWSGNIASGTSAVEVGSRTNNVGVLYGSPFSGKLYDLRYWNIARSATDIASTMNSTLSGSETGLVSAFLLDQGGPGVNNASVSTATNSVSGSNNGTLLNFALTGSSSNWVSRSASYAPANTSGFTLYAQWTAFSTDATLSGLSLSSGTLSPAFASATTSYTASVSNATSSITVTPTVNQANATVQVKVGAGSYATVASGSASGSLSLALGANTVTVLVTAQDGSTTQTYTLTITRTAASITGISPTVGSTLGGTSVVITGSGFTGATAVKFGATNATSFTVNSDTQITATAPATAASTVDITVVNAGLTSATSSADQFTYSPAPQLTNLTLSDGGISPTFASSTTSYFAFLPITDTSITVTATFGSTITATVNGTSVTSAAASQSIALSAGTNTITIITTSALLSSSTTYTLTVYVGTSYTFTYTGASQTYVVPAGITQIWTMVAGAAGGGGTLGGKGDAVYASMTVTPGQVLQLNVGQAGTTSTTVGTFGGGGAPGNNAIYSASGGGASDIRTGGTSLANRVIVGGGGGGNTNFGTGGNGGYTSGTSGNTSTGTYGVPGGGGGTSTAGGVGGTGSAGYGAVSGASGTAGVGGNGGGTGGNGGGGGYYGGGGSGSSGSGAGAGGGSSYVGGAATYISDSLGSTSANGYIVVYLGNPAATVTSISPSAGPLAAGTVVTITGSNFTSGSTVKFGAYSATNITVVNSTSITASAPAGTDGAVWDVVVTTSTGSSATSSADQYTYYAAPTITSLSVTAGPVAGGTSVTITGTKLTGTTGVTVGGVSAALGTVTGTTVVFTTPAKVVGTYDVVLTNPGGTSTKTGAFTYAAIPTITSLSITTRAATGTVQVTVTGTNLTGASAATVGGTVASVGTVTATTVVINTPAMSAGTYDVVVTTPGGSSTLSNSLTYVAAPTLASASITGTAQVGSTLTAVAGAITGTSPTTTFQWQSATTALGTYSNISAATASTYTVQPTDAGNFIRVIISVANVGGTVAVTSAATTAVALASALTPTFGTPTATATGFTVQISNYDSSYTWAGTATASGTVSISGTGLVTVTGVAPGTSSTATITTTRTGYTGGSATVTGTSITGSALTPTFGTPTATADGFTVQISNYSASYTWAGTATASGSVSVSGTGLVTVTGVAPGTSSTATITTTRTGYTGGSSSISGTSITGSALTPTFGTPTATADGFTVQISNYSASYTWAGTATASGTVSISGTGLVTVTGVAPGTSSTATITTTRTGYTGGSATVTGTSTTGSALTPTFGAVTQTATGFTVSITNYNSSYTWPTPTVSAGTIVVGTPSGSNELLTVSGLNPGSSATITATTTRTGYAAGSASTSGSSNLSSDTTLSSLVLSYGTLSPAFASATANYTATVANNISSITITPTVHQVNATIQAKVGSGTYSLLTSGSASGALSLGIGANTVTILVTAQDGTSTGTYVVTVTRSASSDSTLSGLTISTGALSPTFLSATASYTAAESNTVASITVTPTVNQAYATIHVKIGSGSYSTVSSGTPSPSLALTVGANTITVLVIAQDGTTTNTYSVVVTRAPPSHSVSYNLGNGSGSLPTQSAVAEGSTFQVAASTGLSYSGYTFNKWNDGTTNYSPGATYTMSSSSVVLTATWTPTQQSVTYQSGTGGSGSAPTQAAVATAASFTTATNTFVRIGYNFAGWNDGTTTYSAGVSYVMGVNNVVLTATWTPQIYIVTYDTNTATGSPSRNSDSYTYGTSPLNLPTVGTMALVGYTFGGWSTTINGTAISGAYTPVATVTLHAIWIPNVYAVSFRTNGATGTTPTTLNYTVGTPALNLPSGSGLNYPGYQFGGWATTVGGLSVGSSYTPLASIALQAIWNAIPYAISYNLNGGTSAQPASTTQTIGTTFTIAAAPTESGYVFAGWSFNASTYSAGSTFTVGTTDISFTAQWIPLYTVHYVMNGSSTTSPNDALEPSGTSISLAAAPIRDGYNFLGWLDQNSVNHSASTSFTVVADSTLTAAWSAIGYSVSYSLGQAPGSAPTHASVTIGSAFNLATAPTWAGYTFDGWNDGLVTYGAGSSYLVGDQNISLSAQWSAINYTVDFDVNGATSSVPSSLIKTVGQTFTLPATPTKSGWIFDGWNDGSNSYSAGTTYTMPASNIVLTAHFHAPTPTITSLSTTSGSVLGGTSSIITGTNFTLVTAVTVGNSPAVFTINSDTSISIVTPAGANGSADVAITATGGSATKSNGFTYTLLTQLPLLITTPAGTAGSAIALTTSGGSGSGAVSFVTITNGCSIVNIGGAYYVNATHPATCVTQATKAADSTYAAATSTASINFAKIATTTSLALPSNAFFASYNFTIPLSATSNTPGTFTFSDDGVLITGCGSVATVADIASCSWTPAQIENNKILSAQFVPTDSTDYESSTASVAVNVMASSLSGLNAADLAQLGSISALTNSSNSQTFSTADTTLTLTVPANALPSGSTVHLLLDTNGASIQSLLGTNGYLLNSIVSWNAPDGSVPTTSVPISLAITNAGIHKGMVVYGFVSGVSTPLGRAVTNGSVTVYLTQDPMIVVAPTVPDAPSSVLASNGQNQSSIVSWLAPSNDGGEAITGYTVTSSGGQSCTTNGALSCTVSGLVNGTSYTFTVTATNTVGVSAASSQSPAITPVGPPTITTPATGLSATYQSPYSLAITASGSASIASYVLATGTLPAGLTLNGVSGVISGTPTSAGSYTGISITATDANLQSATTSPFTVVVNQESVTATLSITPTTLASTGTAYTATLTATAAFTGSSTGAVTYAASNGSASGCSITASGNTLTLTATTAGTCLITVTQAADNNYSAGTSPAVTFTFTKATQSQLHLTSTSGQVNTPLVLTATGGSGTGTTSFQTSSSGCSITGSTLTATTLGSCSVLITNPGDTYYAAESTTASVSIGQIPLSVPTSIVVTAVSGNSLSVAFTGDSNGTTELNLYVDSSTSTPLITRHAISSGVVISNLTPGTTYYIALTAIGTGNYSSSLPSARYSSTTLALAATPTISVAPLTSSVTLGQSASFVATASVGDSGSLSYQWSFGGVDIAGATSATYTFTPTTTLQAGVYTVTVTNSKNGTQSTATATASLSIAGALSITTPSSGFAGTVGQPFALSFPAGGGATPLGYSVTSGLSALAALGLSLDTTTTTVKIDGTPTHAGSATVAVTVTDANAQSATSSSITITIAPASQSIAFTLSSATAISTGHSFVASVLPTLTSSGNGTGAITYAITNGSASGCALASTVDIETITSTTAGSCTIIATKASDNNYLAATSAPMTFTFTQAPQGVLTITSATTGTLATPLTLTSTGGSGTGTLTYSVTGSGCSITANILSATQATACVVTATNSGDTYYAPTTSAPVSVSFQLATLATPVITSVLAAGSSTSLTVTYTADSHATSITLNLYSTAVGGVAVSTSNFVSGSTISGLTPGTTYYFSLIAIGTSPYANSLESVRTSGATLTGAVAPIIDLQPTISAAFTTVGQMETLTVSVHSSDGGALNYQWFFGGSSIPGATSAIYIFTTTSTLQSGDYHAVVGESLRGTSATTTSANVTLTVSGPIQIATPSAGLSATQGFAYSLAITASGGTTPLSYSLSSGAQALAASGLALNTSTGVISGTPTETGTVTVAVTATDSVGSSATTSPFTITLLDDPDAIIPTFDTPVSTSDGFTVHVTNYDAAYTEQASVTAGSITNSIPQGASWLLTITGLAAGQSATLTITTSRIGYVSKSASVTASSSSTQAPPPPSFFVAQSPVQIALSGTTFTITAATLEFSYHGGGIQPAVLRTQVLTLMGNDQVLFTFKEITDSTTVTLPAIESGVLYTAQESVSEKDAAENFSSHNFSVEYAQWQNDRAVKRALTKTYYAAISQALSDHEVELHQLALDRVTKKKLPTKYFDAKAAEVQQLWHAARAAAELTRQQGLDALRTSDLADLRNAGISVLIP